MLFRSTGESLEPSVGGAARRERYLLLEDDLHQRLEARLPIPKRRRTVPRDNRGEVRVPSREFGDALGECRGGQLERHLNLTS